MKNDSTEKFPKWAPIAGAVFAATTVLFLMALVVAAVVLGTPIPPDAHFLIVAILALTVAAAGAFFGGDAAAKGRIPSPWSEKHPVQFSVAGGIAAFVIVLTLGSELYRPAPESSASQGPLVAEYCRLLSPLITQLNRTESAFERWTERNLYLEAEIIREGNVAAMNLLIDNSRLVIPELRADADDLIRHYDRWLEEFDRVRGGVEPDSAAPFVFVGPAGYPFPSAGARRFR